MPAIADPTEDAWTRLRTACHAAGMHLAESRVECYREAGVRLAAAGKHLQRLVGNLFAARALLGRPDDVMHFLATVKDAVRLLEEEVGRRR